MIIGLHGHAGSGKHDAARGLTTELGYRAFAFADPLRASLLRLNPLVGRHGVTVQAVVEEWGWNKAVNHAVHGNEIRRLLVEQGLFLARDIDPDLLVKLAGDQLGRSFGVSVEGPGSVASINAVFSDVRLPNEAQWVRGLGGLIIEIVRPGSHPASTDRTEQRLPEHLIDAAVIHNGDNRHLTDELTRIINNHPAALLEQYI